MPRCAEELALPVPDTVLWRAAERLADKTVPAAMTGGTE